VVLIAGAPFGLRVSQVATAGDYPQPVVRMAGTPFLDLTLTPRSDMCIHGICHNLTAMPGLRGIYSPRTGG